MIVDIHAHHINPQLDTSPPLCRQPALIIQSRSESKTDVIVLSDPFILKQADDANLHRLKAIQMSHSYFAEFCKLNDEYFRYFAYAYPHTKSDYSKELIRALDNRYCVGLLMNSNVDGKYPDSKNFREIFEIASDKRLPIFIHPNFKSIGYENLLEYHLLSILGRPTDVSLAAFRMILSGVLEEFRRLKIICS